MMLLFTLLLLLGVKGLQNGLVESAGIVAHFNRKLNTFFFMCLCRESVVDVENGISLP